MTIYLVIGIIVLICLIAVAISVVGRARSFAIQETVPMEDELAEFQQMREDGKISEEEYRKLKRVFSEHAVRKHKDA